jgi:hypothetical protein
MDPGTNNKHCIVNSIIVVTFTALTLEAYRAGCNVDIAADEVHAAVQSAGLICGVFVTRAGIVFIVRISCIVGFPGMAAALLGLVIS